MIRLRKVDGTSVDIGDAVFVEICSLDGLLASLVYRDSSGVVRIFSGEDDELHAYAKNLNLGIAGVVQIKENRDA